MHLLPQLRKLQHRFENELAVIGVHAAKFPSERKVQGVRQAVCRLRMQHPVLNDPDRTVWRRYNVMTRPTLVLIDPAGNYVGHHSGDMLAEAFVPLIERLVNEFEAQERIDRTRLPRDPEVPLPTVLSYPAKLLADAPTERLFIADTGHNRVVVVALREESVGEVVDVIGSGGVGCADGSFETATFDQPRGMALRGSALYIADSGNHAVRAADLETRTVTRVAGTGERGHHPNRGAGPTVALNSPWDLTVAHDVVFIAMAGFHQIWIFDPKSGKVGPFVGNGREEVLDGVLTDASLAEPNGLTNDGTTLYVVDSESSAIRAVEPDPRTGRVYTLVGSGLSSFGDIDAYGRRARLQHPVGIGYHDGTLLITDTFNHKIKQMDLDSHEVSTLLGTGTPGLRDGSGVRARLYEPSDVDVAGGRLFIADTNNHVVRVADPSSGDVETLRLHRLDRLPPAPTDEPATVRTPSLRLPAGKQRLTCNVTLPEGYNWHPETPLVLHARSTNPSVVAPAREAPQPDTPAEIDVGLTCRIGNTTLEIDITAYFCDNEPVTRIFTHRVIANVPIQVTPDATPDAPALTYDIPSPTKE